MCRTTTGDFGTCYTEAECKAAGGIPSGPCASSFGVCCLCKLTLNMHIQLIYISTLFSLQSSPIPVVALSTRTTPTSRTRTTPAPPPPACACTRFRSVPPTSASTGSCSRTWSCLTQWWATAPTTPLCSAASILHPWPPSLHHYVELSPGKKVKFYPIVFQFIDMIKFISVCHGKEHGYCIKGRIQHCLHGEHVQVQDQGGTVGVQHHECSPWLSHLQHGHLRLHHVLQLQRRQRGDDQQPEVLPLHQVPGRLLWRGDDSLQVWCRSWCWRFPHHRVQCSYWNEFWIQYDAQW